MSEDLSREERVEVDAAVHDAYLREDGSVRTNAEAAEVFDRALRDAIQAHKRWPGVLIDAWQYAGMKKYIHARWRELAGRFGYLHKDRVRSRTNRRGTRVRDEETGREHWVQDELLNFTIAQLERAISEAVQRIDEERANIAMYRSLIDLLEETGESTVKAALDQRNLTLEQYLADVDAA